MAQECRYVAYVRPYEIRSASVRVPHNAVCDSQTGAAEPRRPCIVFQTLLVACCVGACAAPGWRPPACAYVGALRFVARSAFSSAAFQVARSASLPKCSFVGSSRRPGLENLQSSDGVGLLSTVSTLLAR